MPTSLELLQGEAVQHRNASNLIDRLMDRGNDRPHDGVRLSLHAVGETIAIAGMAICDAIRELAEEIRSSSIGNH